MFSCPAIADVPVTGVSLNNQSVTMTFLGIGSPSDSLIATVVPEYATNKNVTWSSSNEEVATVSDNGLVIGINPGVTDITVTTEDCNFTAVCRVTVTESDVQWAIYRHSSDKGEVAAKTVGFSEEDFEIVEGNVVIKKSIAEAIAKNLLRVGDIEVFPVPWFEAEFRRSGQSGKIAVTEISMGEVMFDMGDMLFTLSITSPNTGEFLKAIGEGDFKDGEYSYSFYRDGIPKPGDLWRLGLEPFIRDGGRFDLDQTKNGLIVGQLAIVKKTKSEENKGCNAGMGSTSLLLAGLTLLAIYKKY